MAVFFVSASLSFLSGSFTCLPLLFLCLIFGEGVDRCVVHGKFFTVVRAQMVRALLTFMDGPHVVI